MRIYLASMYGRRDEMYAHAVDLWKRDWKVTSSWMTGESEPFDYDHATQAEKEEWAMQDVDDLIASDCLILFTEEPEVDGSTRGGRFVELGIALALNKRVIVVGPRENLFCWLPHIDVYEKWIDCLADLDKEFSDGG